MTKSFDMKRAAWALGLVLALSLPVMTVSCNPKPVPGGYGPAYPAPALIR